MANLNRSLLGSQKIDVLMLVQNDNLAPDPSRGKPSSMTMGMPSRLWLRTPRSLYHWLVQSIYDQIAVGRFSLGAERLIVGQGRLCDSAG
jgi:hypothetical protein